MSKSEKNPARAGFYPLFYKNKRRTPQDAQKQLALMTILFGKNFLNEADGRVAKFFFSEFFSKSNYSHGHFLSKKMAM